MYTQRIIHFPALGKGAELRAALEERNNAANAGGVPHSLAVSMFSPEAAYVHAIRFDNLAAIEAYQDKNQSDPAFRTVTGKIASCLSRPQAGQLWETVIAAQPTTTPRYQVRIRLCPALGQEGELRSALQERIQKSIPGLIGAALSTQVASVDGPAYAATLLFSSMAGIDEWRAATAKDPATATFLKTVATLQRIPPQQRILRVIAPFPPAR